jgi:hypothetical protein
VVRFEYNFVYKIKRKVVVNAKKLMSRYKTDFDIFGVLEYIVEEFYPELAL